MSEEVWGTLRSNGRLHAAMGYRSIDIRARLTRAIAQARRQGASWSDIAFASMLSRRTVRRLTRA